MAAALLSQAGVVGCRHRAPAEASSLVRPGLSLRAAFGSKPSAATLRLSHSTVVSATAEAETLQQESSSKPTPSYVSLSDNYAVIDVGGTQHLVEEGRWYTCNRLTAEPGSTIQFGRVLARKANGSFSVGRPYLDDVVVEAEILEELKGPKITVFKFKPKKHYQRTAGHRQPLTKFLVTKIANKS